MLNIHIRRPKRLLTILPIMIPKYGKGERTSRGRDCCELSLFPTNTKANVWETSEEREPPTFQEVSTLDGITLPELLGERVHGLRRVEALLVESKVELRYGNE